MEGDDGGGGARVRPLKQLSQQGEMKKRSCMKGPNKEQKEAGRGQKGENGGELEVVVEAAGSAAIPGSTIIKRECVAVVAVPGQHRWGGRTGAPLPFTCPVIRPHKCLKTDFGDTVRCR